jgi:ribosomal-protein-alanine N-acetyltransferase
MDLSVREMTKEDLDAVYRINRLSFTTDAWSRDAMEREFRLPYSHRFVVESGGEVIGYTFVWVIRGEAFIMTFAVDPGWRRKGVGRWFLGRIIDLLRDKARVISLDVRKSNLPAIRLYRSMGFKVVKERPRFYSDGENALLMELRLDKMRTDVEDKREEVKPADR